LIERREVAMFAVVNEAGQVFYGASESPAVFETKEQASAVAAYFNEAYGPLSVREES
jgi:hypothetical protein